RRQLHHAAGHDPRVACESSDTAQNPDQFWDPRRRVQTSPDPLKGGAATVPLRVPESCLPVWKEALELPLNRDPVFKGPQHRLWPLGYFSFAVLPDQAQLLRERHGGSVLHADALVHIGQTQESTCFAGGARYR